jgi:glycosyltransferase involved in cell wall biosynthesis
MADRREGRIRMPVRVSVVVPNFNYARFLDERLQSILRQTWSDLEVIVVDDASSDESRAVIERYRGEPRVRVRYFEARSNSTYQRWNDGAAMAAGELLWFAGADDSSEPEFLAALVPLFDRHPRLAMAYSRARVVDGDGREAGVTPSHQRWDRDFVAGPREEVPYWLDQKTIPTASAVVLRRDLFERSGGFDTTLALAADHLLWLKLLREGEVAYLAAPLTRFRVHERTVRASVSKATMIEERYRVFAYLVNAFDVDPIAREALVNRLARAWADLVRSEGWGGTARHRRILAAARPLDWRAGRRAAEMYALQSGPLIRGPLVAARYAWRRWRDAARRRGGRRVLRRYARHYAAARRVYANGHGSAAPGGRLYGFGLMRIRPDERPPELSLPDDFDAAVARLARAADAALSDSSRCRFVPRLLTTPVAPRTADIDEMVRREVITVQLRDALSLDGLREVADPVVAFLERHVYRSFLIVDKAYVYRSPICDSVPRASWVWHYDNHPPEMLKAMVYLTDVTDGTAPLEYLHDRATDRPLMGAPLSPLHLNSRIPPAVIERHLAAGCEPRAVTGPRGTIIVFDDNIVHRGTLARTGHRDVLVLQVRPSLAAAPRIDPRWTGSFTHRDLNADPRDMAVHPKVRGGTA